MRNRLCYVALSIGLLFLSIESVAQCGNVNRALNRPSESVSAKSAAEWHVATQAVDGSMNPGSSWTAGFVENQTDTQWIKVNLGASYNICRVYISWEDAARDYTIEISSDDANWTTIDSVTNNTDTGNDRTGLSGVGQYVRVHMTKKQGIWNNYSIFELRVYDQAVIPPSVSITSPINGGQFLIGNTLSLAATANNSDKVEFFYEANATLNAIGTADYQSPYIGSWTPTQAGVYKIKAVATNNYNTTDTAEVSITVNAASTNSWSLFGNAAINDTTQFIGTTDNHKLIFKTNNSTRLSILGDGRVRIGGGMGPDGDATAKLSVDGTVYARKLKITQATWADFVFEKDYKLLSLKEVDDFIRKNKHLPGVPAAVEVLNKPIDLSETQTLLLKKIEELTLYIIQQEKKLDQLQKEIESIKSTTKAK